MGVLNKIKGRMSGYNALTKGPSKSEVGSATEFDTMGFNSGRERGSGSQSVAAGLAAGNAVAPPQQESSNAAEVGQTIGNAIMEAKDKKPSERKEFIDGKKEEGLTGKEARSAYKEKRKGAKIIKKYLKENPIGFIKI